MVFPIPISPMEIIEVPRCESSPAMLIPMFKAASSSSSLIAGSFRKFFVPLATFAFLTPSIGSAVSTPMSTGMTSTPASLPRVHAELMPLPRARATVSVTSLPHCETFSSVIPLSAQKITAARFVMSGYSLPCMAPILQISVSKSPRLSRGLAILSQFALIPAMTGRSGLSVTILKMSCLLVMFMWSLSLMYTRRLRPEISQ